MSKPSTCPENRNRYRSGSTPTRGPLSRSLESSPCHPRLVARLSLLAVAATACADEPAAPPPPPPLVPTMVAIAPDTALAFNALGVTVQLTATVRDQHGNIMRGVAVEWASGDTSVATVTAGIVTAIGNGTTAISASAGAAAGQIGVAVMQELASMNVETPVDTITALGETVRLVATAFDANGQPVPNVRFDWWHANDPSHAVITVPADTLILTVDSTGLVTALGNTPRIGIQSWNYGPTKVFAAFGELVDSVGIVVRQTIVSVLLDAPDSLLHGEMREFAVDAVDANGNSYYGFFGRNGTLVRNATPFFMESTDTTVVRVDETALSSTQPTGGGTLFAVGTGTATVTATAFNTELSAGARVTVYADAVGYPIHVNYVGDVPAYLRPGIEAAVRWWERVIVPTPSAPFVFLEGYQTRRTQGICPEVTFEAGDELAPGLHLFVGVYETDHATGWACPSEAGGHGTSAVPMNPIGVIGLQRGQFQRTHEQDAWKSLTLAEMITRHEIGHVLGIGTGERWRDQLVGPDTINGRPYNVRFTDSTAIAVFDKMADGDFPPTTPKIPVSTDRVHWDGCAGHFDLMGTHRRWWNHGNGSFITEMTLASLRSGYRYDPDYVKPKIIEQDHWNSEHTSVWGCQDGRFYPLQPTGNLLRMFPEEIDLSNDVIGVGTPGPSR